MAMLFRNIYQRSIKSTQRCHASKEAAQSKPDIVLRSKQSVDSPLAVPLRCDIVGRSVGL